MGLPANKDLDVISFGDVSGGVNLNDPAISLADFEVQNAINALFLKKGFKRWPGAENFTAKGAVTDVFKGQFSHSDVDGTQYLFEMHGGKLYEVNKTTGALTELYDLTGTGEAWGGSHWGTFFLANGSEVIKVEGSTATKVGIDAPTTGAAAAGAGGTLADGVYQVFVSYARKVSGSNILYSVGNDLGEVTLGGGSNTVDITSFANSADPQVNNKVVWLSDADTQVLYFYGETGNNTSTSISISSATSRNASVVYDSAAATNYPPGNFTFLHTFDNRVWGSIGNVLYYSKKAFSKYDLEKFPVLNKISYPYEITGIFSIGTNLYINTRSNGVILQNTSDIAGTRFEHYEQEISFKYMRTVADWNGTKIGLTNRGVRVFDGYKFQEWDYGFNIKKKLDEIYNNATADNSPCGYTYRRNNRIEYALSFMDTTVGETNNNRTYVLNLSQTYFESNTLYKTPWEVVGRGFNYVALDDDDVAFFAQSFTASSTIYKELSSATTEKGIYNDDGKYLDTATDMLCKVVYRTIIADMFTKTIIEEMRALFALGFNATLKTVIADDIDKNSSNVTDISAYGVSYWDSFEWDNDYWTNIDQYQYAQKGDQGVFGYSWYLIFEQTANDPDLQVTQFDVRTTLETGRGI